MNPQSLESTKVRFVGRDEHQIINARDRRDLAVDEDGVIQWIDQTDDYRLRSDNARVLEAVRSAFG